MWWHAWPLVRLNASWHWCPALIHALQRDHMHMRTCMHHDARPTEAAVACACALLQLTTTSQRRSQSRLATPS
jgi:hypothetical protein